MFQNNDRYQTSQQHGGAAPFGVPNNNNEHTYQHPQQQQQQQYYKNTQQQQHQHQDTEEEQQLFSEPIAAGGTMNFHTKKDTLLRRVYPHHLHAQRRLLVARKNLEDLRNAFNTLMTKSISEVTDMCEEYERMLSSTGAQLAKDFDQNIDHAAPPTIIRYSMAKKQAAAMMNTQNNIHNNNLKKTSAFDSDEEEAFLNMNTNNNNSNAEYDPNAGHQGNPRFYVPSADLRKKHEDMLYSLCCDNQAKLDKITIKLQHTVAVDASRIIANVREHSAQTVQSANPYLDHLFKFEKIREELNNINNNNVKNPQQQQTNNKEDDANNLVNNNNITINNLLFNGGDITNINNNNKDHFLKRCHEEEEISRDKMIKYETLVIHRQRECNHELNLSRSTVERDLYRAVVQNTLDFACFKNRPAQPHNLGSSLGYTKLGFGNNFQDRDLKHLRPSPACVEFIRNSREIDTTRSSIEMHNNEIRKIQTLDIPKIEREKEELMIMIMNKEKEMQHNNNNSSSSTVSELEEKKKTLETKKKTCEKTIDEYKTRLKSKQNELTRLYQFQPNSHRHTTLSVMMTEQGFIDLCKFFNNNVTLARSLISRAAELGIMVTIANLPSNEVVYNNPDSIVAFTLAHVLICSHDETKMYMESSDQMTGEHGTTGKQNREERVRLQREKARMAIDRTLNELRMKINKRVAAEAAAASTTTNNDNNNNTNSSSSPKTTTTQQAQQEQQFLKQLEDLRDLCDSDKYTEEQFIREAKQTADLHLASFAEADPIRNRRRLDDGRILPIFGLEDHFNGCDIIPRPADYFIKLVDARSESLIERTGRLMKYKKMTVEDRFRKENPNSFINREQDGRIPHRILYGLLESTGRHQNNNNINNNNNNSTSSSTSSSFATVGGPFQHLTIIPRDFKQYMELRYREQLRLLTPAVHVTRDLIDRYLRECVGDELLSRHIYHRLIHLRNTEGYSVFPNHRLFNYSSSILMNKNNNMNNRRSFIASPQQQLQLQLQQQQQSDRRRQRATDSTNKMENNKNDDNDNEVMIVENNSNNNKNKQGAAVISTQMKLSTQDHIPLSGQHRQQQQQQTQHSQASTNIFAGGFSRSATPASSSKLLASSTQRPQTNNNNNNNNNAKSQNVVVLNEDGEEQTNNNDNPNEEAWERLATRVSMSLPPLYNNNNNNNENQNQQSNNNNNNNRRLLASMSMPAMHNAYGGDQDEDGENVDARLEENNNNNNNMNNDFMMMNLTNNNNNNNNQGLLIDVSGLVDSDFDNDDDDDGNGNNRMRNSNNNNQLPPFSPSARIFSHKSIAAAMQNNNNNNNNNNQQRLLSPLSLMNNEPDPALPDTYYMDQMMNPRENNKNNNNNNNEDAAPADDDNNTNNNNDNNNNNNNNNNNRGKTTTEEREGSQRVEFRHHRMESLGGSLQMKNSSTSRTSRTYGGKSGKSSKKTAGGGGATTTTNNNNNTDDAAGTAGGTASSVGRTRSASRRRGGNNNNKSSRAASASNNALTGGSSRNFLKRASAVEYSDLYYFNNNNNSNDDSDENDRNNNNENNNDDDDNNNNNNNNNTSGVINVRNASRFVFQLAPAIKGDERKMVVATIRRLGASVVTTGSNYDPSATHLITFAGPPERTEKYLAFRAAGKPIVTIAYILDSAEHAGFLKEDNYNPTRTVMSIGDNNNNNDENNGTTTKSRNSIGSGLYNKYSQMCYNRFQVGEHEFYITLKDMIRATHKFVNNNNTPERPILSAIPFDGPFSNPMSPNRRFAPFLNWRCLIFGDDKVVAGISNILLAGGCTFIAQAPFVTKAEYEADPNKHRTWMNQIHRRQMEFWRLREPRRRALMRMVLENQKRELKEKMMKDVNNTDFSNAAGDDDNDDNSNIDMMDRNNNNNNNKNNNRELGILPGFVSRSTASSEEDFLLCDMFYGELLDAIKQNSTSTNATSGELQQQQQQQIPPATPNGQIAGVNNPSFSGLNSINNNNNNLSAVDPTLHFLFPPEDSSTTNSQTGGRASSSSSSSAASPNNSSASLGRMSTGSGSGGGQRRVGITHIFCDSEAQTSCCKAYIPETILQWTRKRFMTSPTVEGHVTMMKGEKNYGQHHQHHDSIQNQLQQLRLSSSSSNNNNNNNNDTNQQQLAAEDILLGDGDWKTVPIHAFEFLYLKLCTPPDELDAALACLPQLSFPA